MPRTIVALLALLLAASDAAGAANATAVHLLVDGRPVAGNAAVSRGGVIYVDVASVVRTFSGLVTYGGSSATVSIGTRVAIFEAGATLANLDGRIEPTGGKSFFIGRELYVPLTFFITHVARGSVHVSPNGSTAMIMSRPVPGQPR